MRYRVEELAARARISVDTVRFYQTRGLLELPEREGRVVFYSDGHLARLERIRDLKAKGFTLKSIKGLLSGEFDAADEALVAVLDEPGDPAAGGSRFTLAQLAERTEISESLLEALEREGLIVHKERDGTAYYSEADAEMVSQGLALLGAGLPLSELLVLAREHDRAMREVAERAVDVFIHFVRDPIRAQAPSEEEAAAKLVEAFRTMLPATSKLVARHFEQVLLAVAQERIESVGTPGEIEATERAQTSMHEKT
ncbi:MAG: MerR family transcriptional regulator [Actinomycetota bacterium]